VEEEDSRRRGGGGLGWLGRREGVVGDCSVCGRCVFGGREVVSECLDENFFGRSWD
jgi:hypothetical protein